MHEYELEVVGLDAEIVPPLMVSVVLLPAMIVRALADVELFDILPPLIVRAELLSRYRAVLLFEVILPFVITRSLAE